MTRHRPVAETRLALVRAALKIVAEEGVHSATTRRIVGEAGVSLASFHYAFESHEELMSEVVRYAVSEEYRSTEPVASTIGFGEGTELLAGAEPGQVPSVYEFALRSLGGYLDGLKADPAREKAMLVLTFWALRGESTQELAQGQYARYDELSIELFETVSRLTGCGWRIPVDDMATLLVSLIDGITIAWLVRRDDAKAQVLIEAAARLLAEYAVPGGADAASTGAETASDAGPNLATASQTAAAPEPAA